MSVQPIVLKNFDEHFFREHITFTSAAEMQQIAQPLQMLGIKHFAYNVYFHDGSQVKLVTHPEFTRHYYQNELFKYSGFLHLRPTNSTLLAEWVLQKKLISDSMAFGISPGFVIAQKNTDCCEYFHFTLPLEQYEHTHDLTQYLDLLYRFIAYFRDRGHTLIQDAFQVRIILPHNQKLSERDHCLEKHLFPKQQVNEFLKKTTAKRLYFDMGEKRAYLTQRETDVLDLLSLGKRSTAIVQQLRISPKTLEMHMKNIKQKMKCDSLFDLGLKIGAKDFHRFTPSPHTMVLNHDRAA